MKTNVVLLLLTFLCAAPMSAQRFEVSAGAVGSSVSGSGQLTDEAELEFEEGVGFGAAFSMHWTDRVSTELAVSRISSEAAFGFIAPPLTDVEVGDLEMTPVTLIARWHFAPQGFIDPYIGAGGAYVMFEEISASDGLAELGLERVNFEDAFGFAANAGVSMRLGARFRLIVDAKYLAVESDARTRVSGEEEDSEVVAVEMNPLLVSAGIGFRF